MSCGGATYTNSARGQEWRPVANTGNSLVGYAILKPVQSNDAGVVQPLVPTLVPSNIFDSYPKRESVACGIALIVIGVAAVIDNAVGIAFNDYLSTVGHGFWCGGTFIITGAFGMGAASKKKSTVTIFMILCTVSMFFAAALFGFGAGGASENSNCSYFNRRSNIGCNNAASVINGVQAAIAIAAATFSIWGTTIGCRKVCCCARYPSIYRMKLVPYGDQQTLIPYQRLQERVRVHESAAPAQSVQNPPSYAMGSIPQHQTMSSPTHQTLNSGLQLSNQRSDFSAVGQPITGARELSAPTSPPPSYVEAIGRY